MSHYEDWIVAIKGRARMDMIFTAIQAPPPADRELQYTKLVVRRLTST